MNKEKLYVITTIIIVIISIVAYVSNKQKIDKALGTDIEPQMWLLYLIPILIGSQIVISLLVILLYFLFHPFFY